MTILQAILRGEGHPLQPLRHRVGELGELGHAPLPDGPRREPQEHEVKVVNRGSLTHYNIYN